VQADWLADIKLALNSAGVDAFALNLGTDYWQPTQYVSAFVACWSVLFPSRA
jgi:glucan endo-1,3-alpha-glucosidase